MCGRYLILDEENNIEIRKIIKEIDAKYAGTPERAEMRTGEIFPTNVAPVLLSSSAGAVQAVPMKWGYPRWDGPGVVINARSETAGSKSMFRASLATRRCVIPASGFFEWAKNTSAGKKHKYFLRLPDDPVMYMAGLYGIFQKNRTGEAYRAFVILTAAANSFVAPIHDRMPVIIEPEKVPSWLHNHTETGIFLKQEGPPLTINA